MIVSFTRRIKGKEGVRLSVSIPKEIMDAYKLKYDQPVAVVLQDRPIDPDMSFKFYKQLKKAGTQGLLVYLRKEDVEKYELKLGMTVFVKLITLAEEA